MRKLVTIQKVKQVLSIDKSDHLELIRFENIGWQCVVQKIKNIKVGDIGVYFEVDSFLPIDPRFDFLKKTSFRKMFTGEEGYRLRTITLRGAISQGLFISIEDFPELKNSVLLDNVTEKLGVLKWEREPSISMEGNIIGDYPAHTPKTNQDRIQNCIEFFDMYKGKGIEFERTMKLEGTSVSFHFLDGEMGASSHHTTYEHNDKFSPWKFADERGLEAILSELNLNITIQGEFMGPKIQGNIDKLIHKNFFVFNIWDINKGEWYSSEKRYELVELINERMDQKFWHVPVLDESIKIFDEVDSLEEILLMADGPSIMAKYREGDVYKSKEKFDGAYIQFKVISNKYLLKEK